ncbi:MAG: methylenetetrahydrofolate reductase C-terminal domain-containing protein [Deltaproteobacteria bacterium]|nr:methylenetetrahydrofolate reductase C-terminal domain-containing protein [Deltaproteobacteria bacterium]MBW1952332.1 methylenetetrahydrofolate reductase C-terminal domain-containing protein [Deltaproteobacteria bacterium]MBW1986523.1 methylenetetrahydrofolate reductase C-terminal domain-containing protein [Deltaproteobacteria bacterium]MBW2135102.1 methylenetetrahydrofolate reductase C-terminal domain-containing protein [Deltaproteobacteria bacterium]
MIIAERKPFDEIKQMINDHNKVLIVGCGTCVAVCLTGGEKEVGILAAELRIALELEDKNIEIGETTVERQCDREFLEAIAGQVEQYDAVISMACGVGVQFLAEMYPEKPVYPAVNTTFLGANEDIGFYTERCSACSTCYLALTGGICPVTMCSKGLLNGPCGGPIDGMCEVDRTRPCAWCQIYERLKQQGRLDLLTRVIPAREFRHKPTRFIHPAYKKKFERPQ